MTTFGPMQIRASGRTAVFPSAPPRLAPTVSSFKHYHVIRTEGQSMGQCSLHTSAGREESISVLPLSDVFPHASAAKWPVSEFMKQHFLQTALFIQKDHC